MGKENNVKLACQERLIPGDSFAEKLDNLAQYGFDGILSAFTSALLCNWMVTLGAVMAFSSTTTSGKITAMWLPIMTFFALGYEHAIVNMFLIPAGMMLNANISVADWWLWNGLPVIAGNIAGGMFFTGLILYWAFKTSGNKLQ